MPFFGDTCARVALSPSIIVTLVPRLVHSTYILRYPPRGGTSLWARLGGEITTTFFFNSPGASVQALVLNGFCNDKLCPRGMWLIFYAISIGAMAAPLEASNRPPASVSIRRSVDWSGCHHHHCQYAHGAVQTSCHSPGM